MLVGNFVFSSFCASHVVSCRLNFCVESTHLGIQTLPWWVWCLNQWGNQLSPLDPSGHNVPAKQGKMHARHLMYRYPQYGCTFRSSNQAISLLFPNSLLLGFSMLSCAFLVWFGHVWSGFFLGETNSQPWIQALQKKERIITSRRRFHSAMHRSNFHLIPHLVSIYCYKFKAYLNHIA